MSPVTFAWSAAWILMGAVAVMRLWRRSESPEPFIRTAYRWLAAAAACLAVGGTAQQAVEGVIGGPAPLRIADLISLAALPALIIGLATITADRVKTADGQLESSRWRRLEDGYDAGLAAARRGAGQRAAGSVVVRDRPGDPVRAGLQRLRHRVGRVRRSPDPAGDRPAGARPDAAARSAQPPAGRRARAGAPCGHDR